MIPVVDIFAGPGGLGEGFSILRDAAGRPRFSLAVSIEKDVLAYETLRMRALWRAMSSTERDELLPLIATGLPWDLLRWMVPEAAASAESEAQHLELGPLTTRVTRKLVDDRIGDEKWVLVGGPPCQAYSLVGRARRKGVETYRPEKDKRQTLYVEYLQILADHARYKPG